MDGYNPDAEWELEEVAPPAAAPAARPARSAAPEPEYELEEITPAPRAVTAQDNDYDLQEVETKAKDNAGLLPVTALTRGIVGGSQQTADMYGDAWEAMQVASGNAEPDFTPKAPSVFDRQVPNLEAIKPSWDDMLGTIDRIATYTGETAGSALAQMAPTAVTGFVTRGKTGPMVVSMAQNYGDVWSGFKQDKDIQAAIKAGKLTHADAARMAAATGVVVGSLDALSVNRIMSAAGLGKTAAKEAVEAAAKKALLRKVAEGGAWEGFTEAAQSLVAQLAEVGIGKPEDIDWVERGWRLLNEGVAGTIGGAGATVATEAVPAKEAAKPATQPSAVPELEPAPDIEPGKDPYTPPPKPVVTPAAAGESGPGTATGRDPSQPVKVEGQPDKTIAGPAQSESVTDPEQLPLPLGRPPADPEQMDASVDAALRSSLTPEENAKLDTLRGTPAAAPAPAAPAAAPVDPTNQAALAAFTPTPAPELPVAPDLDIPTPQVAPVEQPPKPPLAPKDPRRRLSLVQQQEAAQDQVAAGLDDLDAMFPTPAAETPTEAAPVPVEAPLPSELETNAPAAAAPVVEPEYDLVPVEPEIAPTVSAAPQDTAKLGELARQMEQHLYQGVELAGDPDLAEWEHLPRVIRTVAERATRGAAAMRGISPRDYLRQTIMPALGEVRRAHDIVRQRQAESRAAEPTYDELFEQRRQVAEQARETGKPEERARAGKVKGKKAVEVEKQSRTSWWRLEKKAKEEPDVTKRDVDIQRIVEAREAKAKAPGKAGKEAADTEIAAAKAAYTKRVEEKEAAATAEKAAKEEARSKRIAEAKETAEKTQPVKVPKVPPESKALTKIEEEELVEAEAEASRAEASAREKARNEEMSALIKAGIATFDVPPLVEQIKDRGRATIKRFNDHIRKALKGKELSGTIRFGGGETDTGLPEPANSPEENVAIFISRMQGRRTPAIDPMAHITDFYSALAFLENNRIADLTNMIADDQTEFVAYHEEQVTTSITDEINSFAGMDQRTKPVRHAMPAPTGWESVEGGTQAKPPQDNTLSGTAEDAAPIHVKSKGQTYRMDSTASMTGAEALKAVSRTWRDIFRGFQQRRDANRELDQMAGMPRSYVDREFYTGAGLSNVIFRFTNKQLRNLVGDIQVDFVSDADMKQISGGTRSWGGVYLNYTAAERAKGQKPRILINKDVYDKVGPAMQHQIIMHEMVHAATAYALEHNIRGTDDIVTEMRKALKEQLSSSAFSNAFSNNDEFIAEAFTNERFQEFLAAAAMPAETAARIGAMSDAAGHQVSSWWDAVLRMVSNAIAPFRRKGQLTYLEHVVKLAPQIVMTSAEQQADAETRRTPRGDTGLGAHAMAMDLESIGNDARARYTTLGDRTGAALLWVQSSENIRRISERYFGAEGMKHVDKVMDLLLSANQRRQKYQEEVNTALSSLVKQFHSSREAFNAAVDMVYDATKYQVDISVPLTDPANSHVSKNGVTDEYRRAAHARLHPEFTKLPRPVRDAITAATKLLKSQENQRITKLVDGIVGSALRPLADGGLGKQMPSGWDHHRIVQWVLDGDIDRKIGDPQNPKPTDRTPGDAALHKRSARRSSR